MEKQRVQHRDEQQGDERAYKQPAHDGHGSGTEQRVAQQRYHAQNGGHGSHHDGAEAAGRAVEQGFDRFGAGGDLERDFIQQHDAVLDNHAHQPEGSIMR